MGIVRNGHHEPDEFDFKFHGVGVVVIGRNEGERLQRCLESVVRYGLPIVYVDSGSTDDSVQRAIDLGAEVVHLDTATPFTAGRARNEGFQRLMEVAEDIVYVQFIDGDCELQKGWLLDSTSYMDDNLDTAIVCGRRKERRPDASIYNALCDMEWDTPVGVTDSSGGDFLVRAEVFRRVGGFNGALIAGEEPEMCYRMRQAGWKIFRLDSPMTLHDANMSSLGQWARRSSRAGYAYGARALLHWKDLNGYCWRETGRILFWGLFLPLAAALLTIFVSPWYALLFLAYFMQYWRTLKSSRARFSSGLVGAYALFTLISKWTELYGLMTLFGRMACGQEEKIIEYK
jgi:glycosyltransferase involved in cell wall biosynthesis